MHVSMWQASQCHVVRAYYGVTYAAQATGRKSVEQHSWRGQYIRV